MEYFARRPHRRKHPTSHGISWKNPYEDVVLSNGGGRGKGKVFEARDYTEIFAGSSSIPVFDLSPLDDRVGSAESKLDYRDVFGGLRNDDVGVPYEELVNASSSASSVKESNPSPRVSTDVHSRTSSVKSEMTSGEVSGRVSDRSKLFAIPSNEIPQQNGNASNAKKQPESANFFNGTPPKTPERRSLPSLEHEVSRTWSFGVEVESVQNKGCDRDRLQDTNEVSNAPQTSNAPPTLHRPLNIFENGVKVPGEPYKRDDAAEKPDSEWWPFSFDEEFDENSPAALSAAALKKAIDQARESIRIAKMIMERRKQGLRDGSSRRRKAPASPESKSLDENVKSDIVFTPHDGKFSLSIDQSDVVKLELEKPGKNVESEASNFAGVEANEERETVNSVPEKVCDDGSSSSIDQSNVELQEFEKHGKSIEVSEENEECGTVNFLPEIVDDGSHSETSVASRLEIPETETENFLFGEVGIDNANETEVIVAENMAEGDEQSCTNSIRDSENNVIELAENVGDGEGENSNINSEVEVVEGKENYANGDDVEHLLVQPCNLVTEQKEEEHHRENVYEEKKTSALSPEKNDKGDDIEEVIWDEFLQSEVDSKKQEVDQDEFEEIKFGRGDEDEVIDSGVNSKSSVIWDAAETDYIHRLNSEKDEYTKLFDGGFFNETFARIHESPCDAGGPEENAMEFTDDQIGQNESSREAQSPSDEILVENEVNHGLNELPCDGKKTEGDLSGRADLPSPETGTEHLDVEILPEQPPESPETVERESDDPRESAQNIDRTDQQQRIEAIRKGREREKDRLAVERAIREARERAFAEARERAERAAVERASIEVRMRCLAEAQEKLERAAAEKQAKKLRAERAAVDRATVEARIRAFEKAKSHKASSPPDASSHNESKFEGLKHSFSSSDLETGSQMETEQRRKARLERHQRVMERAAKALEEKNRRDLLVLKEQAERNRIAEYLDADIKRWSSGKEGNLRALLSTLHYILSPDSGWQPISLTEIITPAAVKKAYRKATLCVHPDKLQQRGASIQHKYKCEKVFDLLKAAWNKFNSEER